MFQVVAILVREERARAKADTSVTEAQRDALLKRLDAVVIDGPRAGLYRLRLPDTGEEGRKAAIEALNQSGVVTSVLPGE